MTRFADQTTLAKENNKYIRAQQVSGPPVYPGVDFDQPLQQQVAQPSQQSKAPQESKASQGGVKLGVGVQILLGVAIIAIVTVIAFAVKGGDEETDKAEPTAAAPAAPETVPEAVPETPEVPEVPEAAQGNVDDIPPELTELVDTSMCSESPVETYETAGSRQLNPQLCVYKDGLGGPFTSAGFTPDPEASASMREASESEGGFLVPHPDFGLVSQQGDKLIFTEGIGDGKGGFIHQLREDGVITFLTDDFERFKTEMTDNGYLREP